MLEMGKYDIRSFLTAVSDPKRAVNEVDRYIRPLIFKLSNGSGTDIFSESWDNMIILDACRCDYFSKINNIPGDLEKKISKGSTSTEFIEKNFQNGELHDTVYVTANPWVGIIDEDVFHAVITLLDDWDSEVQTVKPSTVLTKAKEAHDTYPDKKLIVHFMQPHQPYLGDTGKKIELELSKHSKVSGWNNKLRKDGDDPTVSEGIKPLRAANHPEVDIEREDIIRAYEENIEIVLPYVERLLEYIGGKSVISSDHGEMLGEKIRLFSEPTYGHHGRTWNRELREVPWLVQEGNERRKITSDPPDRYESVEEDSLESKLEALGYK